MFPANIYAVFNAKTKKIIDVFFRQETAREKKQAGEKVRDLKWKFCEDEEMPKQDDFILYALIDDYSNNFIDVTTEYLKASLTILFLGKNNVKLKRIYVSQQKEQPKNRLIFANKHYHYKRHDTPPTPNSESNSGGKFLAEYNRRKAQREHDRKYYVSSR